MLDVRTLAGRGQLGDNDDVARQPWRWIMCTGRTHVRVCLTTAELLDAIRVRVQLAEEKGQIKRWWDGEHLTMAELVDRIVKTYWAHMERSRANSRRRSRRQLEDDLTDLQLPVGEAELVYGHYELAELVEGIAKNGRGRRAR